MFFKRGRTDRFDKIMESSTIFDDAINLKHILIIYKGTGTCIYFKSFGEETIDPDLISGFLSAVQSFGKDLGLQKTHNVISYGDHTLLFAEGGFIRVVLVLEKSPSLYVKKNLITFIDKFETINEKKLQNWHGQLSIFKNSDTIIDEILHTSVILPHEITRDTQAQRKLPSKTSKAILEAARSLITQDKSYVFLAQVMVTAMEQTKKDPGELILGLTELLDAGVLKPIKLEFLDKEEMSEEQKRELIYRVEKIEGKTSEEKVDLVRNLMDLSIIEREAFFASLNNADKITTSLTGRTIQIEKYQNIDEAKQAIKSLETEAKSLREAENYSETILKYEIAEKIAYRWNLKA
jgi:hypothetical protein